MVIPAPAREPAARITQTGEAPEISPGPRLFALATSRVFQVAVQLTGTSISDGARGGIGVIGGNVSGVSNASEPSTEAQAPAPP